VELHIVIQGRKDLANQLYEQLRDNIESGRLAAGVQLPPSRLLAAQLGLSRKTISDTYSRLTYENYLVGKIGSGTFVNTLSTPVQRQQTTSELASVKRVKKWQDISLPLRHPTLEGTLRCDFIGGATAKTQFPHDEWRRCTQYALRQMTQARGFYSQPEGLAPLRSAIAGHIAFARGVKCTADDAVVCNGAQQALDLIARVLIEPGCTVAMEDPGYTPARLLFAAQGAHVVGVAVDSEGIIVEQIPENAHAIYVTPSHQMPLGMPMSVARRDAKPCWKRPAASAQSSSRTITTASFAMKDGRPIRCKAWTGSAWWLTSAPFPRRCFPSCASATRCCPRRSLKR
jgi:GntR family transcriptional regulator/MocR family aminotransferase